jgi:hypothetical protein
MEGWDYFSRAVQHCSTSIPTFLFKIIGKLSVCGGLLSLAKNPLYLRGCLDSQPWNKIHMVDRVRRHDVLQAKEALHIQTTYQHFYRDVGIEAQCWTALLNLNVAPPSRLTVHAHMHAWLQDIFFASFHLFIS